MRSAAVVCTLLVCGCDAAGPAPADADAPLDLAPAPPDLVSPPGAIGATCAADVACHAGKTPTCFRTLFNSSLTIAPPDGYCSSSCVADADCGAGALCRRDPDFGAFCFAGCKHDGDCRPQYRCWFRGATAGYCFPGSLLDCDPSGAGACVMPGGIPGDTCVRLAVSTGNAGRCTEYCSPTLGCPTGSQCVVYDQRNQQDLDGKPFTDDFVGELCAPFVGDVALGGACSAFDPRQPSQPLGTLCQPGLQCFAAPLPGADGRCHSICSSAFLCTGPETCHDVWSLGAGSPGLCY